MGKQYNISGILDGYIDNEFLIEGEAGADTEAVLNGVMAKVEPKKCLRLSKKIFVAAAVAAALIITAAALPGRMYKLENGLTLNVYPNHIAYTGDKIKTDNSDVYIVEDGRVYFTYDGQNTDITDLIDFDHAYYYRAEDITDSLGDVHEMWIAVGGTPEHIGWFQTIENFDGLGNRTMSFNGSIQYYQYYVDGEVLTFLEWEEGFYEEYDCKYPSRSFNYNWVLEVDERFTPDADALKHYYESEYEWKYPYGWTGETIDVDIPKPENIAYLA